MCSLLLLPVAWVPVPFGFRWSLPADSRSYEGLGGGIAWALDPAFCEQLLPSFHEDAPTSRYYRFVDCDEIKDAFVRAMSTWAANHDFLNFKDVSSECAALGVGRACGLAELYIQATASSNGTEAAYVELRSWAYGSVTTAGVVDGFAFSLLAADLFFSRDDCWYMDSSFCSRSGVGGDGGCLTSNIFKKPLEIGSFDARAALICNSATSARRAVYVTGR